jgi:hypothetical protein
MENEKRNWEAPQIITVNPEQTESGFTNGPEGDHIGSTTTLHS